METVTLEAGVKMTIPLSFSLVSRNPAFPFAWPPAPLFAPLVTGCPFCHQVVGFQLSPVSGRELERDESGIGMTYRRSTGQEFGMSLLSVKAEEEMSHIEPAFQDREEIIDAVFAGMEQGLLLNLFGEAGIGKTRLLNQVAHLLRNQPSPAIVLQVDLQNLAQDLRELPDSVLRSILAQMGKEIETIDWGQDKVAKDVVAQLSECLEPVYLMFDTTEVALEEIDFWRWLEANLVGPLVLEGHVRQIFAGRAPVPWRRVEVRRQVKRLPLGPLLAKDAARDLVLEVLSRYSESSKNIDQEVALSLILEFSFGHPLLSERLAEYTAQHGLDRPAVEFRQELGTNVVRPFVDDFLFQGVDATWNRILWWACVLNRFDATTLQIYLHKVAPDLVEHASDYFFIQGITRLRTHHTVIWREALGDQLYGVIGAIVRHCLEITDPQRYHAASIAAAETLEELASQFPDEDPDGRLFRQEAEAYRRLASQECGL